jgi:hypothetical protein
MSAQDERVRKPFERVYLAACPFCEYREFFSSAVAMLVFYGTHLLDHRDEAFREPQTAGPARARRAERIARHLQRLDTAQYN